MDELCNDCEGGGSSKEEKEVLTCIFLSYFSAAILESSFLLQC